MGLIIFHIPIRFKLGLFSVPAPPFRFLLTAGFFRIDTLQILGWMMSVGLHFIAWESDEHV